jgi:hypothetical protein
MTLADRLKTAEKVKGANVLVLDIERMKGTAHVEFWDMGDFKNRRLHADTVVVCNDEIESTHRHDWVTCTCGNLFVDGGHEYRRRGFKAHDAWEDTSVYTMGTIEVP